jgi:type IV secretory pathway VirB2 component (pilin)
MRTTSDVTSPIRRARSHAAFAVTALAIAAPLALTTAVAIHPADTSDAAATLGRIATGDRVRWTVAHLLEPFAWLVLALVLLLAARLGTGKGTRLVQAGGVLGAIGASATALIVYGHGEAYLQMTAGGIDLETMEPLYDRFYEAMPLAAPVAMFFRLGLVLLGVGLFLTKAVPRWAAALITLVPIIMGAVATAPAVVTAVVVGITLVTGMAGCARAIGQSVEQAQS